MNFSPTYKLESTSRPGVTVTFRRMGPKLRAEVELSVSAARAKCRSANRRIETLTASIQRELSAVEGFQEALLALPVNASGEREMSAEVLAMVTPEASRMSEEMESERQCLLATERGEIYPAFIVAAVQSIAGVADDGGSAIVFTPAMLCDSGPDDLFDEVVNAINRNAYLAPEKAANLSLPTMPATQESGTAAVSTATNAKPDLESTAV